MIGKHVWALAGAMLVLTATARAQPFQGVYIGAGAGYNFPEDIGVRTNAPTTGTRLRTEGGFVGLGGVGYGFGNGWRLELEGNFRDTQITHATGLASAPASGGLRTYGVMANALFDMDVGLPWIYPYVGGGAGYAWSNMKNVIIAPAPGISSRTDGTQGRPAVQAIAGLSFPMPGVPGLSLSSEYRFFGVLGNETFPNTISPGGARQSLTIHNQYNHAVLLGVRYAFGIVPPPGAAPAAPVASAVPAAVASRSYLVFFDWDKATLTDRARAIVKEAAAASTRVQHTRIEVNGYTDTSGTPQYNKPLSIRRAEAVANELVKDGVAKTDIAIQGFGETNPLVPTGDGVREPQNRRVEIIIR
jgi:OOP family OmpA-OmpF porin